MYKQYNRKSTKVTYACEGEEKFSFNYDYIIKGWR